MFLESRQPAKPIEYSISHAYPRPIANKSRTMSPVGTPSSISSSGSSLTSPTGPCPLSFPRHVIDSQSKSRSMSDPPDPSLDRPVVPRGNVRRQSEQIESSTLPGHVHGIHNKARLSGNLLEAFNAEPHRPLSGNAYDNLPSPKKVVGHSLSTPVIESDSHQENYDNVPIPRALNPVASPLSPRPPSGHHLSPDKYDKLPTPRPVSQGSNRSSQDVYDLVPPPRPMSSGSQSDQGLYDVPPIGRMDNEENYDLVPPPRPMSSCSQEDQGLYDIPPCGKIGDQDNYDFVPPPRPTSCSDNGQALYDIPPIAKSPEQENYDFVPPVSRPVAPKPSHLQSGRSQQNYDVLPVRQSIYDVPPVGRSPEEENYDTVPPCRPVAPKPNHIHSGTTQENYDSLPLRRTSQLVCNGQSTMEELANGRVSDQENYDHVPLVHRPVAPKSNHIQQGLSQENYDVVPIRPNSHKVSSSPSRYDHLTSERSSTQENYDIVPCLNRPVAILSSPIQPCTSQDIYDIVPIPRPSDDNYDVVPPPRAISTSYQPGISSSIQSNGLSGHDQRFSEIQSVPPNLQSSDSREYVPPPKNTPCRPSKDAYDPLPNTNRPVSADSGLNASFSSICSLKSEGDYGQEDRYDAPLPALPTQSRDSGSLSEEETEPSDIYDVPPNWESNNNALSVTSDEIYDVPPNYNQGVKFCYSYLHKCKGWENSSLPRAHVTNCSLQIQPPVKGM